MAEPWPEPAFRVLVTGSRTWADAERLGEELTRVWREHPGMLLIHGAAHSGADRMADDWARSTGHKPERHPARWGTYGKRAGMIRNAEMVKAGADLCLAFIMPCVQRGCRSTGPHGTHGASGCADLAGLAGIEVREFPRPNFVANKPEGTTPPGVAPGQCCRHAAIMHEIDLATLRLVCTATDRVPDDRARRYTEAKCPCGRG